MDKQFFGTIQEKAAGRDGIWEMVFESRPCTEDVDSYKEITDTAAFMRAARKYLAVNPVAMFNHNSAMTIGRALSVRKDDTGPIMEIGIARTAIGRDVAELIRAGVVTRMSFMFSNAQYEDEPRQPGVKRLKEFDLLEVGPVSVPANMEAVILAAKTANIELTELKKQSGQSKGSKTMSVDDKDISTAVRAEVDKMVGDFKSQVDELAESQKAFDETKAKQGKLIATLQDQIASVKADRITPAELAEFADKFGADLKKVQADVEKHKLARKIMDNRESLFGWKSFDPAKTPVIYNDHGQPLSTVEQRAWHLFQAPVKYEGEVGNLLKQTRDLYDCTLFAHQMMQRKSGGAYNITRLKSWNILQSMVEYFDHELAEAMKAMSSTGSAVGDEWVPTESSAELYERYLLSAQLESYIPHWDMPSNPATWPIRTTRPTMYRASERTVDNPAQLTKSNMATAKATFTAETFAVAVAVSPEFIEDSIIALVPVLRDQIAQALAAGYEGLLINGDTTATHRDTATAAGYTSASPESYEIGFRYKAIDAGSTQYFDTQSTTAGVGDGDGSAGATFTAKDVRYLRFLMPGHYGANASDLVYVTSLKPFIKLMNSVEVSQPQVYGTFATWRTGELPMIDGSPIVISGQLKETLHTDGKWTANDTTNTHGAIFCFNKTAFKVGQKRGIGINMAMDILTQQWAFVGTMRKSFQCMDSQVPVTYGYNIEC